jgi:hypothetical protein
MLDIRVRRENRFKTQTTKFFRNIPGYRTKRGEKRTIGLKKTNMNGDTTIRGTRLHQSTVSSTYRSMTFIYAIKSIGNVGRLRRPLLTKEKSHIDIREIVKTGLIEVPGVRGRVNIGVKGVGINLAERGNKTRNTSYLLPNRKEGDGSSDEAIITIDEGRELSKRHTTGNSQLIRVTNHSHINNTEDHKGNR